MSLRKYLTVKALNLLTLALPVCALPAFADVTVSTPLVGATVASPFVLTASASPCMSQPISSMGYSFDNSTNTVAFKSASINTPVTASPGAHTLHVKSWGNQGASCVTDVKLTIASGSAPSIPSNAIAVSGIHTSPNWKATFDTGSGSGSATGTMGLVSQPSLSGTAKQFVTTYTNYGGERYSDQFGTDTTATNFLYDGWIYLASPTTGIANIEMDLNQVMANGETVIFGFQCSAWSGTWDYTSNTGTPQKPVDTWLHSNQTCNPKKWTANAWHHVQISYSRDDAGNVTYQSVWLDGTEQDLNVTVPSAFALGWAPTLLTNFQVDGSTSTSGAATIYMDNLTIYRW